MLKKKILQTKQSGTKNVLFFHLRALTHHSLTFNLRFLYELKHNVRLSKTVSEVFYFQFRFVFIKVLYFCLTKCMESLTLKRHNSDKTSKLNK